MKLNNKSLKNISISNTVFITAQVLATIVGIVSNINTDNPTAAAIFLFAPTAAYIFYNIIVQNLVDYGYMYKEYSDISHLRNFDAFVNFKITKRAKQVKDKFGYKLKLQSYTMTFIAFLNIAAQLILIFIYHPDMIG